MTVYLDCNATTPIEPRVLAAMLPYLDFEYGNAGSHGHEFGARAKQAVQNARRQVADIVGASIDDVVFTSGATESNNLALLGLIEHGRASGRQHVVTSAIEHKAVLEVVEAMARLGFEVSVVPVGESGAVDPERVAQAIRPDTLVCSIMAVNNETGVRQPIAEICDLLGESPTFLHVDAAQGYGKELTALRSKGIDLISISGHKIYGPKGIGALVMRRRGGRRAPLRPVMYGGGQERGLRPGTLPVPLIVGLGAASALAEKEHQEWAASCIAVRSRALSALSELGAQVNGDLGMVMPHTLNVSIPGINSEAAMLSLKGVAALSNGSACTSAAYSPSHVLEAMGLDTRRVEGALRFSWCHLTPEVDWGEIVGRLRLML